MKLALKSAVKIAKIMAPVAVELCANLALKWAEGKMLDEKIAKKVAEALANRK